MSSPTRPTTQLVRLRAELYQALHELAQSESTSMQEVLAKAIDLYRREQFWNQTNAAFAALHADPQAWAEMLEERTVWDQTLSDGLEGDVYEDERLAAATPNRDLTPA